MSTDKFYHKKDEQPGLEVVIPQPTATATPASNTKVVDRTTAGTGTVSSLPETNYIENDVSPPPQHEEFLIHPTSTPSPFRPSSHYMYDAAMNQDSPFKFSSPFTHTKKGGFNAKTDTTTTTMMYSPTTGGAIGHDLEGHGNMNRQSQVVHLPVQAIESSARHSTAAAEYQNESHAGMVEVMQRVPFWRRRRFWIIIGVVAGVILVVGGIVGGVLASQGD